MNCPFCDQALHCKQHWHTIEYGKYEEWDEYECPKTMCLKPRYPEYECCISVDNKMLSENYVLGSFYVIVNTWTNQTTIYNIDRAKRKGIEVARLLWLNVKNKEATLDKLRMIATFR
jgi:hypothetical protein